MYTAIYIFTSAETLNNFFRMFKLVLLTVFGKAPSEIGDSVTEVAPRRTYTVQEAVGGFSGEKMKIVRTVITHEEFPEVIDFIANRCPEAFWFHHDIEGISGSYYIKPIG